MTPNENEKLERLIQSVVKDLPLRPAPRSLESRVFAEIERRANLPWYRRSFAHWPLAMRGAFLLTSAAAAAVTVVAVLPASISSVPVNGWFHQGTALVAGITATGQAVGVTARNVLSSVPSLWLYGALAAVAGCYGALMALGTAAYRALRPQSS